MKNIKRKIIAAAAVTAAVCTAFALPACAKKNEDYITDPTTGQPSVVTGQPSDQTNTGNTEQPPLEVFPPDETPKPKPVAKAEYIMPTAEGVNLRSGAGAGYKSLGVAEKNTLYSLEKADDGWYKISYDRGYAYISAKYCAVVQMDKCANNAAESVVKEGCKYLGVKYVYGATRYHDGSGRKLSGFTTAAFDCSSLMQYIFKTGAGVNLQVNTRTQIYQGKTVAKSEIKRGDLLFFTNASRKNNKGVERVGHVALYLGDNYILHTASDYAKIEQITPLRWSYYIQAQRVL